MDHVLINVTMEQVHGHVHVCTCMCICVGMYVIDIAHLRVLHGIFGTVLAYIKFDSGVSSRCQSIPCLHEEVSYICICSKEMKALKYPCRVDNSFSVHLDWSMYSLPVLDKKGKCLNY